jgi:dTDP-4-dehydrorhamnose reductase
LITLFLSLLKMRILITGADGQLGQALQDALSGHVLTPIDLPDVDVTEAPSIATAVSNAQAQLVIHCAAYTDVDGCARDPQLAHRVNAMGSLNVALACQAADATMLHISTNEVFAGERPAGYEEWMPLSPINPYGRSKAAAELYVSQVLNRFYIVRTAWLYGPGGRNFISAILDRARSGGQLRVVADEVGNPTYANDLANAICALIETDQYGIYHLTNGGACSRWAFAKEVLRLAQLEHLPVKPILASAYQRPSTPPPFGALKNMAGASLGISLRPWQEALSDSIQHFV